MEQNLGTLGTVTESYAAGVAGVVVAAALPPTAFGLQFNLSLSGSLDASTLIGYLAGKVGGPIPAEVAAFLELALKAT